eukprot:1159348-Alexandrium_andersonii.AAC.1
MRTFCPPCAGAASLLEEARRLSPLWGGQATSAAADLLGSATAVIRALVQDPIEEATPSFPDSTVAG